MVRITRMTGVAGACTIALLALGVGSAQAQYNIDHYLVYRVMPPAVVVLGADLRDQFGEGSVELGERDKLANPVAKAIDPDIPDPADILYPDEHLSWWRFPQPQPQPIRQIQVTNQFGVEVPWTLGDAEYLLVPAIKNGVGEITLNQHYKCYIADGAPLGIPVNLEDQFGPRSTVVEEPRYFCNPVEKLGPPPLEPSALVAEIRRCSES